MVDPGSTPLGKMLLDEITPVVMVLSTPLVEEACLKNGLSFVQLLSPFCVFNNIDVPVRTASDQPYRLQKFKLRLFYASDIRQPNLEVAKARLKEVITQAGENYFSNSSLDPPPIENLLTSSQSAILPSWFQFFNKELVRNVSFSDHEAFDHPVACLLVVSSKDDQPINKFVDLFNTNSLPSLLSDGAMDPKVLKHYLLVHDNQEDSADKAMKILSEMRNTFGLNECQLLCINSSQKELEEHQDNPWVPYKSDASQYLGRFISTDDMDEIKDTMQELSSKQVIPYMEQKIRELNQQVAATKKGFRNQIKNLWWRKGKDDTPDTTNGYTYSSIESQIRVLGDYAFMLGDYELALSNYRLISTDYKIDKAWKRYAGVQEMMGLTYFMLDQYRKDAGYCMESAFSTYMKLGSADQKNAVRCGLWWVEMLKTRDSHKEAASVYFRICIEDILHSAVMLEQASYCYLFAKPPMLRKYGFHLVLSGDRYRRCNQIKHAIRTFRSAISIFKGTTWNFIKDHTHFHIGQWYASLGMDGNAISHMLQVLSCSHQTKATQELFLREFLQIVKKMGKSIDVPELQLPVINISSLKVFFEDHRTYSSSSAAKVKESLWSSLEEDLIPSLPAARTNWLDLQPKKLKESNICVAGEAVRVDVEFRNPLHISISITGVSLICELSTSSDEKNSDAANRSDTKVLTDEQFEKLTTKKDIVSDISAFTSSEVDFSLGAGETTVAQLTVTPRVEGILKVVGVRWKLSGSVVGFYNFEDNLPKKKVAKGKRKARRSPSDNLKFVVIKNLPKLQGFLQPLPKTAYVGEIQHLVLELVNPSTPVKNLKMKISHPRFLNIGTQDSLNKEFRDCLVKKTDTERSGLCAYPDKASQALFTFPEDTSVQGESPLLWPLWLRAAVPGNVSLYLIIYYEMEDASSVMSYRTLRLHCNLQVLPSLDVSFRINPCPSRLKEFLVCMDVVNRTSSDSFQIHQLSSVRPQWEMSLVQPADAIFSSQSVMPGQALSCFFKLKDCSKSSEDNNSAVLPLLGSDVKMCPQSSSEPIFDISNSPLSDFHNSERMHDGTSNQNLRDTVDFILISQLLKSNISTGVSDSPRLFSHHACHCSTASPSPLTWVMNGPRIIHHNFFTSFCEVRLRLTICNSFDAIVSVHIDTSDPSNATTVTSGWQSLSLESESKTASDVMESPLPESVPPFIWTGPSSTRVQVGPMSNIDITLQVCVFSPGAYDLSNYVLHWNVIPNGDFGGEAMRQSSGTSPGYPYFLTVLQSST